MVIEWVWLVVGGVSRGGMQADLACACRVVCGGVVESALRGAQVGVFFGEYIDCVNDMWLVYYCVRSDESCFICWTVYFFLVLCLWRIECRIRVAGQVT